LNAILTVQELNRDATGIAQLLESKGSESRYFPYRQNRMVIFNSMLFHGTQDYRFKPGYSNRRINVTFLFGIRTFPGGEEEDKAGQRQQQGVPRQLANGSAG